MRFVNLIVGKTNCQQLRPLFVITTDARLASGAVAGSFGALPHSVDEHRASQAGATARRQPLALALAGRFLFFLFIPSGAEQSQVSLSSPLRSVSHARFGEPFRRGTFS
jgi:hypothetical protein